MRQHMSHGDVGFAVAREFGPVLGDGIVEVEQSALDEEVHGERDERFADRERPEQGVGGASETAVENDLAVTQTHSWAAVPRASTRATARSRPAAFMPTSRADASTLPTSDTPRVYVRGM